MDDLQFHLVGMSKYEVMVDFNLDYDKPSEQEFFEDISSDNNSFEDNDTPEDEDFIDYNEPEDILPLLRSEKNSC